MELPLSFAPLAARLAVQAAAVRPAEGARNDMAKVMALVMCAVLEMFILFCEALDARALAGMRPVEVPVPAQSRAGRLALPRAMRARSPSLAPRVRTVAPILARAPSDTALATRPDPWLAWSRDTGPLGAASHSHGVAPSRKAVFPPRPTHVHFVSIS